MKYPIAAVSGLITSALPMVALAAPYGSNSDDLMMSWHGGWGHMFFGGLFMIGFWLVLIVLVVLVVRWLIGGQSHSHPPRGQSALNILEERFARGEIDEQEFEDRKRRLGR